MSGSRKFFPGGGGVSDGYLCLPGGCEAFFGQFYNVFFKYLNFESGRRGVWTPLTPSRSVHAFTNR